LQGVPLPVFAQQRWPGQSGPKRHLLPTSNLTFVTAKTLAFMRFYYTIFRVALLGAGGSVAELKSKQNQPTLILRGQQHRQAVR
jgi:hypothetical protein